MSQEELAALYGVTPKTVWEWQQEGLPYESRGGIGDEHVFDTAKAATWWARRIAAKAAGGETAKDRLSRVQADKIELDIAKMRGTLVDMAELDVELTAAIDATRTLLLQLPERIAGTLDITNGIDAKRDLLREEIEDALRTLSTYDPRRKSDPFSLGSARAAAADDGGAMGGTAPALI